MMRKQKICHLLLGIAISYVLVCSILWHYQTRLIFFPSSVLEATPADRQLRYDNVWLTLQLGRIHGWWIPSQQKQSPVLLYFHGNGSNLGDLVSRLQRFHQWGYTVFAIDYRGYGRSSGPFPNEQRVYEDARRAWSYLTEEREIKANNVMIYGRSLGGAIALDLAVQHPEAAGLILESSLTSMKAMAKSHWSIPLMPLNYLLTQKFDSLAKAPLLQVPVLLIHGKADTVVPPQMSRTLYDTIPTFKTLILIEGASHNNLPAIGENCYDSTVQTFIKQYAQSES